MDLRNIQRLSFNPQENEVKLYLGKHLEIDSTKISFETFSDFGTDMQVYVEVPTYDLSFSISEKINDEVRRVP